MKTIVSFQDLTEIEIRPDDLLERFRAESERSVRELLVPVAVNAVACPGCSAPESAFAFEKHGLRYRECRGCGTLFVSPRPEQSALDHYYRDSPAVAFWRTHVLPSTGLARAAKLHRPRAEWILDGLAEHALDAAVGLDLTPYGVPLAETVLALSREGAHPLRRVIVANVAADLDPRPTDPGAVIDPRPLAEVSALGPVDFVSAFDALERVASPAGLVAAAHAALRPWGLLFLSAPSISGFDLQVLWDRSRTITPPEKINLFSIEALQALFPAEQWTVHELSTPGMFDADAVRRAIAEEPDVPWPRIVRRLVRDHQAAEALQEFLQRRRLSSFARIFAQRKD